LGGGNRTTRPRPSAACGGKLSSHP